MSPIPESTVEIARAAGIPSRASRIIVFSVSVVGLCFVAGVIGVMVGYTRPQPALTETPSLAPPSLAANHAAPRVAVITGAHEEITESPILVAGKDAATSDPTPSSIPVSALAIAPAPTMAPAPARFAARPAARPSAPPTSNTSTGVIRVPAGMSGVLVDGAPHKTSSGAVAVVCGRHTVKAPGQSSRLVIVPCGGSASL